MQDMKIPWKRQDDYYGVAAIALCEASIQYTDNNLEEQVSFGRFAKIIIKNQIIDEFRKENAHKRKCFVVNIDDEELASDLALEDDMLCNANIVELLRRLPERQKKVLFYLYEGYSHKEIGEKLNVCRSRIGQIRNRIRRIAKEVML